MNSKNKLFFIMIILFIFSSSIGIYKYNQDISKFKLNAYNNNEKIYNNVLQMQSDNINALALLITNDDEIKQAYVYDDSTSIIEHLSAFWKSAKKSKLLNELHFFKAPAQSFVNFSLLKSMGTDVSDVRTDIKWAISTKNSSSHTMVCNMYAGIRTTFPIISDDGEILGALSMGKKIDWLPAKIKKITSLDSFLIYNKNSTKNLMKGFYTQFLKDKIILNDLIIANKTIDIPDDIIKKINLTKDMQDLKIKGKTYSLNIYDIYDFDKQIMAYMIILTDLSTFNENYLENAIIYIIGSLIILVFLYTYFSKKINITSKKITQMKNLSKEIKNNNFSILNDIQVISKTNDELSSLEVNIINMARSLEEIHNNLINKIDISNKHLTNTLELIDEFIIYTKTDLNGNIIEVSDAMCKISKYTKGELIGKNQNILNDKYTSDEFYIDLQETIKNKDTWFGEQKNSTKNGSYYWVDTKILPEYKNNEHIGYVSFSYDITAKKDFESEHEKLLNEKKLASLGELMGNIAHQWRQPLSVISTVISGIIMQREMGISLDNKKYDKSFDNVILNVEYLSKTIDDFRYIIDSSNNKMTNIDVNKNINNSLNMINNKLKNDSINVHFNIDNTKNIYVKALEDELIQCYINIFINAIEILEEKSIIDRHIFISTSIENNIAKISIKDNAGGIPLDIIDNIFEPYFTTKHQSMGTGMGLHMVHNIIVNIMECKIEVSNEKYIYNNKIFEGANFSIYLNI